MGTASQVWAGKLSKSASWEGEGVAVAMTGEAGGHRVWTFIGVALLAEGLGICICGGEVGVGSLRAGQ